MKNSKRQSSLLNPQGQAVVEYVLMLVVTVAMVTALAYQIFRPMREFLRDYMGLYIACLLETGELPSMGNTTTEEILQDEGCNAKFQAASLKNGRPPNSSTSGSGSGDGKDKSKSGSESGSSADGSGGSGSGSSSAGSASSRGTGRNLLTRRGGGGGGGTDAPAADNKTVEIPFEDTSSKFYNRRTSSESSTSVMNKKIVIGGMVFSEEEQKKQKRKENAVANVTLSESAGPAPKKIKIEKPERKIAQESEEEPFTFGNFFRILLIAAIIIALIVVLGSQALKIVKSAEK